MKIKKIKDLLNLLMLKNSNFFDENYYKLENPDVTGNLVKHYYYVGYKEGRNPSKNFDNNYYLKIHKDVKDAGINPLVHYLKIGKKENRKIRSFNGLSISKIYYKLYHRMYYANIHAVQREKKINLFVYDINSKSLELIKKIINYTNVDRIIYINGDDRILNSLSYNSILEKCYRDYYLDIGIKDLNICIDEKSFLLFNHSSYIDNLYFYLNDINDYSKEFICYLSYYASCEKAKILSFDKSLNIKKTVTFPIDFRDLNSVLFDFKYHFVLGLEIINDYFLRNYVNHDIHLYFKQHDIHCKISLDNELEILPNNGNYIGNSVCFNENNVIFGSKKILDFESDEFVKIYDRL